MRVVYSLILILIVVCLSSQTVWAEIGYTVKEGDTLYGIAEKFGVSIEDLAKENNIEIDSILSIDQRLVIPYSKDEPEQVQSPKPQKYTIRKGDCLERIARQFDCTVDELAKLNNLKRSSILRVGHIILIPQKIDRTENVFAEPEKQEPVKFKKEVSVDVDAKDIKGKNLLDLSQLDDATITIINLNDNGDEVETEEPTASEEPPVIVMINRKVAAEEQSIEPAAKPEPSSKGDPGFVEYKIQKGDTVSKISKKFDVSESQIFDANGISKRTILRIGRTLKIPTGPGFEKRKDDSLISRNLAPRDRLVRKALEYKGLRYVYGGTSLSSGVDCSGFTMKVFEKFGVNLPHSSSAQAQLGKKVNRTDLLPGDLVFFGSGKRVNHVGIYIGNDQVIHASTSLRRISVDNMSESYFAQNYITARRIL